MLILAAIARQIHDRKGLSLKGKKGDLIARLARGMPVFNPPGPDAVHFDYDATKPDKKKYYTLSAAPVKMLQNTFCGSNALHCTAVAWILIFSSG